jgi:hypothetical protein
MSPDSEVTITVTREVALALCSLAGLDPDERGRYGGAFWALDEATRAAVVFLTEGEDR